MPGQLPPSPGGALPFFGHTLRVANNPLNFFRENAEKCGPLYHLKSPVRRVCIVNSPEIVKYVLQENHRHYVKSFAYDTLKPLLGEGLLTSEGDFWRKQRRLAQPAFHREALAGIVQTMGECTAEAMNRWKHSIAAGKPFNLTEEANRLTLEIVSHTLFHTDVSEPNIRTISESLGFAIERGAQRMRRPFLPPRHWNTPKNIRERKAVNELDSTIGNIVQERQKNGRRYHDLLDMLLNATDEETGEGMDAQQLKSEVITLFIAGHETTAVTLQYALYLLCKNPEWIGKLREESLRTTGGQIPEAAQLREMPYTRMVIDETLRLCPPAWMIGRRSLREEVFDPYVIPAGTTMGIPVFVFHRSPRYWHEPERFHPERFHPDRADELIKFAYFPFGGGPRLCIGQMFAIFELQVILSMILPAFSFHLPESYTMQYDPLVTLRPKNPLIMKVLEEKFHFT